MRSSLEHRNDKGGGKTRPISPTFVLKTRTPSRRSVPEGSKEETFGNRCSQCGQWLDEGACPVHGEVAA